VRDAGEGVLQHSLPNAVKIGWSGEACLKSLEALSSVHCRRHSKKFI